MITHRTDSLLAGLLAAALFTSFASAQNVGIGTTTPKSKLSVNGSTASGGLAIGDASYTSTTGTVAPVNGAIVQGSVGIGTTAPVDKLHVFNGAIYQNSANGLQSTRTAAGGVRTYRNGAQHDVFPHVNGFFDVGANENNPNVFEGRMFYYLGIAGEPPPWNVGGRGLGFALESETSLPQMLLSSAAASFGNLGIGDTTPTEARLVVRGGQAGQIGTGKFFSEASSGNMLNDHPVTDANISIYANGTIMSEAHLVASGRVVAAVNVAPSDERIKNVAGMSDSAADLRVLEKIRITDYTMKDPFLAGAGSIKKVIAQEVEEVYPRAVSRTTGYLPDVLAYGIAEGKGGRLFEITMEEVHGLAAGAKVKLILPDGEAEYATIGAVEGKSFTVKLERGVNGGKIFVYGRQVNDLRTVDYDALAMLNISATQALAKRSDRLDAKVSALEAENAGLKEQVADLKAANEKLGALSSEMEALKQAVAALRAGGESTVRTVSLKH